MPRVTYDGDVGGGDLFVGIKFCIMQRVPQRDHLKQLVTNNGGELVPLEKQADIVIADHARAKYAPEGSASWKFITESVETGELKDLDEYIIADTSASKTAMKSPGNAVGNSAPMKMTRMPYTQEDDKFLRKWVANALKAGGSARGNVIYQELEKANNRHTAHSWRDRWIKRFSSDEDNLDQFDVDATELPIREPTRATESTPRAEKGTDEATPAKSAVKRKPLPSTTTPTLKEPVDFTKEDDKELAQVYESVQKLGTKAASAFWDKFATKYTRHSADDWCRYYYEVLRPIQQKKVERMASQGPVSTAKRSRASAAATASSKKKTREEIWNASVKANKAGAKRKSTSSVPTPTPTLILKQAAPVADEGVDDGDGLTDDTHEVTEPQVVDPKLAESEPPVEDQIVDEPKTPVKDSKVDRAESPLDILPENVKVFLWKLVHFLREKFNKSLTTTGHRMGGTTGRWVEWARFQEVVHSYGGFNNTQANGHWADVAKDLDFTPEQISTDLLVELEEWYDEVLRDFDEFMKLEQQKKKELAEQEESNKTAVETAAAPATAQKRSRAASGVAGTDKRRRTEKGKGKGRAYEVPSTPEHVYNSQPKLLGRQPSPVDESDSDIVLITPMKPSSREESNDLDAPVDEDDGDGDGDGDVTPTQQLMLESASSRDKFEVPEAADDGDDSGDDEEQDPVAVFRQMAKDHGYSDEIISKALHHTTLDVELASRLLEPLKTTGEVPKKVPGVWTDEDDEVVRHGRVVKRHGEQKSKERVEYLVDLEASDDTSTT